MASLLFTDADGTWKLHNGKPYPADRFASWTPDSPPIGDFAHRQSDGAMTRLRLRTDFGVSFDLPKIPAQLSRNLLVRSEEAQTFWSPSNVTIGTNAAVAPDGSTSADKLQETNTVNAVHAITQTVAGVADNTNYVFSAFLCRAERNWALFQVLKKNGDFAFAYVNLMTGAFGGTANIVATGARLDNNSFWRVWIVANMLSGGSGPTAYVYTATADGVAQFTGTTGSGIYCYGMQLEPGTEPTPYLMTQGSAFASGIAMTDIADRLIFHLLNGGTCSVNVGDASGAWSQYATCGLKPDTTPSLQLSDRRTMEFTLSLRLINLAGSPVRMVARYGDGI